MNPSVVPTVGPTRSRLLRSVVFMTALCSAIAIFLTVLDGGGAASKFIYSFAIGLSCWAVVDGGQLALKSVLRRWRGTEGRVRLGWGTMLPLIVIGVFLGPLMGQVIGDAITGYSAPPFWNLGSRGSQITLVITVLAMAISVIVHAAHDRAATEALRAEAAQREAAEAQLRLLQSQLEPHMLFNTLANLRVLIGLEPARAQAMLDRLIAFLRSTLAASRTDLHALSDEFARLDDYLALMQVRMGPRLRVSLELPPALAGLAVPPLLLQPLVENAIKHGLEAKVDGGHLRIAADRDGDTLVLTVEDDGLGLSATPPAARIGTGFGVSQVRERLKALHGDRAGLQLQPAPGGQGTRATVRLPAADLPRAA